MTFQNLRDVEEALRPGGSISARDLYTIWSQRLPVQTAAKKEASRIEGSLRPLEWLQNDLETVTAFTERALSKQEYLLVCDTYEEAKVYWSKETRSNDGGWLKQMARLASHCAEAKTRLGFTRSARSILEPLSNNPNLGRREQARIRLQMGDIVREESHHAPDPSTRRVTAENALALYQSSLALDSELLQALVLTAAMQFVTSGNEALRLEQAQTSARQVLTRIETIEREQRATFQTVWYRAVAYSILGRLDEAATFYNKLRDIPGASTTDLAEARYNSQFLAEALGHPRQFFHGAFPPLQLLVFSGHVPDLGGHPPRFPLESVPLVRELLRKKLDQLGARTGLVSAAAGADLLFIEALQERPDARVHVVLPWSTEEFFRTSVEPFEPVGGKPIWEPLFRRALEQAATVRELGQVYEPSDDVGWEFTQEVTAGLALNTARMSRLDVQPVALWDGQTGRGAGGTQSFVELWRQQLQQEPEVIELPLLNPSVLRSERRRFRTEHQTMRQEVKSMLFADIVGYSKLTEKVIADFVEVFMHRLSVLLATSPHAPRSVNTWGDAIYAVFDFSQDAGLFALSLTKMIRDGEEEWKKKGLIYLEHDGEKNEVVKRPLNIRVGLHTGPVLAHYNPVLRQLGYTGSHVSRAARIEPIAERGEVYASEEFAAMAELSKEIGNRNPGVEKQRREGFVCEYAGSKSLAKGYPGLFRVYRVIPERNLAIEELARAAHQLYCEQQEREGKTQAENPSIRPWEELSDDLRDANRSQVTDIPYKLYMLGYELAPSSGLAPTQIVISPEQLEVISRREHDRWMAERQRQGWTYGKTRDDARKHHPSLVPWEELSEAEKQKDRDTVHNMPVLISKAGFQIRKVSS
jgi:class 3 adenylate cyclase